MMEHDDQSRCLDGNDDQSRQEMKRKERRGSAYLGMGKSELSPDSKSPATENNKKPRDEFEAQRSRENAISKQLRNIYVSFFCADAIYQNQCHTQFTKGILLGGKRRSCLRDRVERTHVGERDTPGH